MNVKKILKFIKSGFSIYGQQIIAQIHIRLRHQYSCMVFVSCLHGLAVYCASQQHRDNQDISSRRHIQ